jgi:hypothetical protein
MGALAFIPIDERAKDGRTHTLRDEVGHLWCGRWKGGCWVLAGDIHLVAFGEPIRREITEYAGRIGGAAAASADVRPQGQTSDD